MYANSQFAIAVQTMTILAHNHGQKVNSELMAQSVNTNPVIIRRILTKLVKGGLMVSSPGATGGSMLARPAEQITLLDIYRIEGKKTVCLPENEPNQDCVIGRSIQEILCNKVANAERAFEHKLAEVTIADLHHECVEVS